MDTLRYITSDWPYVLSLMPPEYESLCESKLALTRRREISNASDYLRLCMAYSVCDMSLRATAAWASAIGVGELSDVAVLNRLRAAPEWLGSVVAEWLFQRGVTRDRSARNVHVLDATTISKPGSTGTDWRVHLRMDLAERRIEEVQVTDDSGGERLDRYTITPGDILVGDRGYATNKGIAHVLEKGGHVLIRSRWTLALQTATGSRLDILSLLETLSPDEIGDWPLQLDYRKKSYPVRLVAIRKSPQACEKTKRDLRRAARKKGKQLKQETLKAAQFIFVITDLPDTDYSCSQILELYRMRWQIELVFKRLKSILGFDRLRAKDKDLSQTYLLGKILGALVIDELSGQALDFFPWGFRLPASPR